jgi:hypothetical protein
MEASDDFEGSTYIDPLLGSAVEYACHIVLAFFGERPAVCLLQKMLDSMTFSCLMLAITLAIRD